MEEMGGHPARHRGDRHAESVNSSNAKNTFCKGVFFFALKQKQLTNKSMYGIIKAEDICEKSRKRGISK